PGKNEFEQIRESGYRARDLVRQILTISREDTMDVQPLYLSPIIKEALKLLRSTLPTNIKIIEKIDKHLNLIMADSIQMYQVFMNLCTNAKHAMEKGNSPRLEVELQNVTVRPTDPEASNELKPGHYVKLSVKDNGTGIDPNIEQKIFEPYFTTKNKETGTGLGLATTLGIVKQFGGHITVDSDPGKGTCFNVFLPVCDIKNPDDRESQKNVPVEGEGKILFVDDEKQITIIAKKMFHTLGFSVMTANSGKEALECFARAPDFFDLMITDLAMPEMTGVKLAKEVMRIRPGFPVIMCTGHSDTFDEATAKESGIMEYITKPYNLKELSVLALKYIKKIKAA
ncbi:MAG: response regulator, partial [Proteobacteria bacterium]|nr:response regulator [Pseudomonadota bacterium]